MKAWIGAGVLGLGLLFAPRAAHAGIEACGNIDVRANSTCKVEVSGGCKLKCEPVSFNAACAGRLSVGCAEKNCKEEVQVQCTGGCMVDEGLICKDTPNGGSIDCNANCSERCSLDCDAACAGQANKAECTTQCKASCSTRCQGSCKGSVPTESCKDKCGKSCDGSCRAVINRKCDLDCQASGFASCKAELKGGCEGRCENPEGALFCDGQYVDTGNNLASCMDALNKILQVKVDASASCSGSQCQASAAVSLSPGSQGCDAASSPNAPAGVGFLAGLGVLAGFVRRRRG